MLLSNFVLNMVDFSILRTQSHSYSKLRLAETFSFQMWPLDGFEFETPELDNLNCGIQSKFSVFIFIFSIFIMCEP
jgi:hypothetical protein